MLLYGKCYIVSNYIVLVCTQMKYVNSGELWPETHTRTIVNHILGNYFIKQSNSYLISKQEQYKFKSHFEQKYKLEGISDSKQELPDMLLDDDLYGTTVTIW